MSRKITAPLIAFAALIGVSSLAACNTVEGFGQDLQKAGNHVEKRAEDAKD